MFEGRAVAAGAGAGVVDADVWVSSPDRDAPSWLDGPTSDHGWLFGTVAERLGWVLERDPDSATLQALEALAQERMSAAERVLFARACERQAAAVAGLALAAVGEAAADRPPEDEPDLMAVEIGAALRLSPGAAAHRAHVARRAARVLPVMLDRLCAGAASALHLRILDELTVGLSDDGARTVDAAVAARAETMTAQAFRRLVRREVIRVAPVDAEVAHRRARRDRRVALEPADDGMAWLHLLLTAADGIAAMATINAGADAIRTPDDPRTHGERQAQVALERLLTPAGGDGAASPGWRCEIQAVIDLPSLLGLADRPGELVGYGPVAAAQVRELLTRPGSTIRRLVTDPVTGTLVDYGRTRYRPDALLVGLIRTRDRTCRFPGCAAPAIRCDIDHRHPYQQGGPTSTGNCCCLCRRHHRLKTFNGFRYTYDEQTGIVEWTTPLGFRYRVKPPTYDDPDPPDA